MDNNNLKMKHKFLPKDKSSSPTEHERNPNATMDCPTPKLLRKTPKKP